MNYVEILSVPAPLLPWSGTEGGVAGARERTSAMTTWQPDRFTITRLRPGYTKAEVDEFVARIEGTLGRAMPPDRPVTVDEVRNVRFTTTRLRDRRIRALTLGEFERGLAEVAR